MSQMAERRTRQEFVSQTLSFMKDFKPKPAPLQRVGEHHCSQNILRITTPEADHIGKPGRVKCQRPAMILSHGDGCTVSLASMAFEQVRGSGKQLADQDTAARCFSHPAEFESHGAHAHMLQNWLPVLARLLRNWWIRQSQRQRPLAACAEGRPTHLPASGKSGTWISLCRVLHSAFSPTCSRPRWMLQGWHGLPCRVPRRPVFGPARWDLTRSDKPQEPQSLLAFRAWLGPVRDRSIARRRDLQPA